MVRRRKRGLQRDAEAADRPPVNVEIVGLGGLGDIAGRDAGGETWWVDAPAAAVHDAQAAALWRRCLPGATVQIRPGDKRRRGQLTAVLRASTWADASDCDAAGRCGGCPWRHVPAPLARAEKIARVQRLFSRYAVPVRFLSPPPAEPEALRRRTRLHARRRADTLSVGFLARRSDQIAEAARCPALTAPLEALRIWLTEALGSWCERAEIHAVDGHEGTVVAIDAAPFARAQAPAAERLLAGSPRAARVIGFEVRSPDGTTAAGPQETTLVETAAEPWPVRCTARGFAQATAWGNRAIRAVVANAIDEAADAAGGERLRGRELYAGSGNLTALALARVPHWTTVEQDRAAVARAEASASLARARGGPAGELHIEVGDVDAHVGALAAHAIRAEIPTPDDVWLLDPARPGAKAACDYARVLRPRHIVYVSCAPETLRRDVDLLVAGGMKLVSLVAIDAFGRTPHTEVVARLVRPAASLAGADLPR